MIEVNDIKEYLCIKNLRFKRGQFVKGEFYAKWVEFDTYVQMRCEDSLFSVENDIFDYHFVYYPSHIDDKIESIFE